ncbi:MAG: Fic family protein [Candidatus Delongbacteria bacterium]|nr:Fic family protein [Candidatus Delongbacteria bacterium]MBN2835278.1 Fic family protein [Candidatus Delongbacteria bacterium]
MKIPEKPLNLENLLADNYNSQSFIELMLKNINSDGIDSYFHWDEIKYKNYENYTQEQIWLSMKLRRTINYKKISLFSKDDNNFVFSLPDFVLKKINLIDKDCADSFSSNSSLQDFDLQKNYLINSLYEEPISSSQLEGASTTRKVAERMLERKTTPRSRDEKMIYNNYQAMIFVKDKINEDLTIELILELHKIISNGTLKNSDYEGKLRDDDDVRVVDFEGNTIYTPPTYNKLEKLLSDYCSFVNSEDKNIFIPPIIKGIILHFYLAYLHPFEDGNGRTARALFYWFMAKNKYWLIEYISISKILKDAPIKYAKSYLFTETDDNDLTYFIVHQLDVIIEAIRQLHNYIDKKIKDIASVTKLIYNNKRLKDRLNSRQLSIIKHAIKHPNFVYTVKIHESHHNINNQTARTDLLQLSDEFKLLRKVKDGRSFIFISPEDISELLIG